MIEYYSLPGGGLDEGETIEECIIREIKEEYSVDDIIKEFLGNFECKNNIEYLFECKITNGIPVLGGEEKENNSPKNYYEIRKIKIIDIPSIHVNFKEKIAIT